MRYLACEWIVSLKVILSQLAVLSDSNNVQLAYIGRMYLDNQDIYRLRFVIKGTSDEIDKFFKDLPDEFGFSDWYPISEEIYALGTPFSKYWRSLDASVQGSWLDEISRGGSHNQNLRSSK